MRTKYDLRRCKILGEMLLLPKGRLLSGLHWQQLFPPSWNENPDKLELRDRIMGPKSDLHRYKISDAVRIDVCYWVSVGTGLLWLCSEGAQTDMKSW